MNNYIKFILFTLSSFLIIDLIIFSIFAFGENGYLNIEKLHNSIVKYNCTIDSDYIYLDTCQICSQCGKNSCCNNVACLKVDVYVSYIYNDIIYNGTITITNSQWNYWDQTGYDKAKNLIKTYINNMGHNFNCWSNNNGVAYLTDFSDEYNSIRPLYLITLDIAISLTVVILTLCLILFIFTLCNRKRVIEEKKNRDNQMLNIECA
jgi:hypothetical protein